MNITKRSALIGTGALLLASPALIIAHNAEHAIYDSRVPESAAFASEAGAAGARLIDIADEERRLWRTVRNGLRPPLIGLTTWPDWINLRSALEDQRLRVRCEMRLDYLPGEGPLRCPLALLGSASATRAVLPGAARSITLFAWRMA